MSKTAIITGGGRGIGRATAIALSSRSWRCVLVARTQSQLDETVQLCPPGSAIAVVGDVTRESDVGRAVEIAVDEFGGVDALVNNAGYAPIAPVEETSLEDWQNVIDINLTSAFIASRAVWAVFRQRGGGVIVNVSSRSARDPFPLFVAYAAAKAGLNGLGLVLARQGAEFGIRVHTVAPGSVETGMFRAIVDEESWPKSKTLTPEEVAEVIVACVEGTLRYASGEVIYLNKSAL